MMALALKINPLAGKFAEPLTLVNRKRCEKSADLGCQESGRIG